MNNHKEDTNKKSESATPEGAGARHNCIYRAYGQYVYNCADLCTSRPLSTSWLAFARRIEACGSFASSQAGCSRVIPVREKLFGFVSSVTTSRGSHGSFFVLFFLTLSPLSFSLFPLFFFLSTLLTATVINGQSTRLIS